MGKPTSRGKHTRRHCLFANFGSTRPDTEKIRSTTSVRRQTARCAGGLISYLSTWTGSRSDAHSPQGQERVTNLQSSRKRSREKNHSASLAKFWTCTHCRASTKTWSATTSTKRGLLRTHLRVAGTCAPCLLRCSLALFNICHHNRNCTVHCHDLDRLQRDGIYDALSWTHLFSRKQHRRVKSLASSGKSVPVPA